MSIQNSIETSNQALDGRAKTGILGMDKTLSVIVLAVVAYLAILLVAGFTFLVRLTSRRFILEEKKKHDRLASQFVRSGNTHSPPPRQQVDHGHLAYPGRQNSDTMVLARSRSSTRQHSVAEQLENCISEEENNSRSRRNPRDWSGSEHRMNQTRASSLPSPNTSDESDDEKVNAGSHSWPPTPTAKARIPRYSESKLRAGSATVSRSSGASSKDKKSKIKTRSFKSSSQKSSPRSVSILRNPSKCRTTKCHDCEQFRLKRTASPEVIEKVKDEQKMTDTTNAMPTQKVVQKPPKEPEPEPKQPEEECEVVTEETKPPKETESDKKQEDSATKGQEKTATKPRRHKCGRIRKPKDSAPFTPAKADGSSPEDENPSIKLHEDEE